MLHNRQLHTFLTAIVVITCLASCARNKPSGSIESLREPSINSHLNKDSSYTAPINRLTPFQEIVFSLVSDSLDILHESTSKKLIDTFVNGIEIPDQSDQIERSVLLSSKKEEIAFIAGLIVQNVYGDSVGKDSAIPQAVIYFHRSKVSFNDLMLAAAKASASENRSMDAYNECLNLLVSTLSANFKTFVPPKEGLYIRASNNDLYFNSKL